MKKYFSKILQATIYDDRDYAEVAEFRFRIYKNFNGYCLHEKKFNPKSARQMSISRHQKIKENGGEHNQSEIWELYNRQKGQCVYCKTRLEEYFEKDHIIPISRGGMNDIYNIQLLCKPCNLRKGVLSHDEYVEKICRVVKSNNI